MKDCCNIDTFSFSPSRIESLSFNQIQKLSKAVRKLGVIYRDIHQQQADPQARQASYTCYEQDAQLLDVLKSRQTDPNFTADLGALSADLLEEVLQLSPPKSAGDRYYYPFFEKAKSTSLLSSIRHADAFEHVEARFEEFQRVKNHQFKNIGT